MKNRNSIAIDAVLKSGRMLKKEFANFDRSSITLKSHNEILTKCDLMSEEIILNEIRKNFLMDGILSEEHGIVEGRTQFQWILDPIDGTTNFSMHNPLWSISLALARDNELVLGMIYAPMMDELYLAEKDNGAKMNGKKIKVSKIDDGKILNTYCHGKSLKDVRRAIRYYTKQKSAEIDCRQLGSAALELAYVAAGRVESIVIPGTNDWDVAAGVLLVREAGGKVTDFNGKKWELGTRDILASNGKVHTDILKILK
jgi:myo-inositol-1(or 4)-monophosphatase